MFFERKIFESVVNTSMEYCNKKLQKQYRSGKKTHL